MSPSTFTKKVTSIQFWGRTGIYTRIVTAYIQGKSANKQLSTVKAQHCCHLKSKGDHRCPCQAAREDVTEAVAAWLEEGDCIVLFADANKPTRLGLLNSALTSLGL
eukprot:10251083-Ditylum_brightwellii.AAC.1